METHESRRILIVAHKSVAAPALLEAIRRRTEEGPCRFSLLIPDGIDRVEAAWTLRFARKMLSRTAGVPIDAVVAESDDAFMGVVDTVRAGRYDEIMISLLSDSDSRWALEDLPGRAEALGIPVTVVRADAVST
jgi:ABC-type sugar transport system substrate-binding protein